jgi:hypothetical protein
MQRQQHTLFMNLEREQEKSPGDGRESGKKK